MKAVNFMLDTVSILSEMAILPMNEWALTRDGNSSRRVPLIAADMTQKGDIIAYPDEDNSRHMTLGVMTDGRFGGVKRTLRVLGNQNTTDLWLSSCYRVHMLDERARRWCARTLMTMASNMSAERSPFYFSSVFHIPYEDGYSITIDFGHRPDVLWICKTSLELYDRDFLAPARE